MERGKPLSPCPFAGGRKNLPISAWEKEYTALKAENQVLWVQRMNNIRSAAMEIVANDLIYCLEDGYECQAGRL